MCIRWYEFFFFCVSYPYFLVCVFICQVPVYHPELYRSLVLNSERKVSCICLTVFIMLNISGLPCQFSVDFDKIFKLWEFGWWNIQFQFIQTDNLGLLEIGVHIGRSVGYRRHFFHIRARSGILSSLPISDRRRLGWAAVGCARVVVGCVRVAVG